MGATVVAVTASAQATPSAAMRMTVRSTEYGKALFGPSGKVVYVFGADRGSTSYCYGVCAKAWPPLLTSSAPIAGPGVRANLLGTTKRKNGRLQVTWTASGLLVGEARMSSGDSHNASLALTARHLPVDRGHMFVLWAGDRASSMQVGRFMVDRTGGCRVRFNLPETHSWRRFWVTQPGEAGAIVAST